MKHVFYIILYFCVQLHFKYRIVKTKKKKHKVILHTCKIVYKNISTKNKVIWHMWKLSGDQTKIGAAFSSHKMDGFSISFRKVGVFLLLDRLLPYSLWNIFSSASIACFPKALLSKAQPLETAQSMQTWSQHFCDLTSVDTHTLLTDAHRETKDYRVYVSGIATQERTQLRRSNLGSPSDCRN